MTNSRLFGAILATLLASTPIAYAQSAADVALADQIAELTNRRTDDLLVERTASGAETVDLKSRFQQVFIAENRAGELAHACVGTSAEANHFFGRNLRTGVSYPAQPKSAPTAQETAFYVDLIERAQSRSAKAVQSSTITVVFGDGLGEGFNDLSFLPAEGGNSGTLGQQRRNVFNEAARIWSEFLDSSVTIRVGANFDPLTPCSSGGGVLGAAGPENIFRNFSGAPLSNTFYPVALASKLAGFDLSAGNDISTTFNSSVDIGCLGPGTRFYYGLNNSTPANRINLLVVVLHELGHGLGSLSFADPSTGAFAGNGPDIWSNFQRDASTGLLWRDMSNGQRVLSATNLGNLRWEGPNTRIASDFLTQGRDADGRVELYTPVQVEPGSSVSHWSDRAAPNLLMEPAINTGLPLTLDLTRQQMRDIGWYRDTTADNTADSITTIQLSPSNLSIGSPATVTWTNTGGFDRNVTIELSTNGGTTFPITIASNIANTGTHTFTVPNNATTQGRLRVREHDFVAPLGSTAQNFSVAVNSPPTLTPAATVMRQQGSNAQPAVAIATVSDAQSSAGSLVVTLVNGGSASGVNVTGISNNNGNVSGVVSASCSATAGSVRLQVSDGSASTTGDLSVQVDANTMPTLSYPNANLVQGAATTISPSTGPSDNGTITALTVQSTGTYTGGISVNPTTGVISLSNAAPAGAHTVQIRATDNCGAQRSASLTVNVGAPNSAPTLTPAAALSRQQGSAAGAAVAIATVDDAQTPAAQLTVTQVTGGSATGITLNGLVNDAGTIRAQVTAGCTATAGTVRLQVSDGSLTSTGDLQVSVQANTPPTLGYAPLLIEQGGSANATPNQGPSDNGSITDIKVIDAGSYAGAINVDPASGIVALSSANPLGVHTVQIRATDNCVANTVSNLLVTVGSNPDRVFADGFETGNRTQGR